MRNTRTTLAVLATTALLLTGCSASPDVPACKAAMQRMWAEGMSNPDGFTTGTRPKACNGVDDATLQRLVGEVISEAMGS